MEITEEFALIIRVLSGERAGKYLHTGIEKFKWLNYYIVTEQLTRIFCCCLSSNYLSLVTKFPLNGSLLFADSVITILHMFLSLGCLTKSFKFNYKSFFSFFFLESNNFVRA